MKRLVNMELSEFEQDMIADRLEGWELVEFLQIPVKDILAAAIDLDWITEDNITEVLEFAGVTNG